MISMIWGELLKSLPILASDVGTRLTSEHSNYAKRLKGSKCKWKIAITFVNNQLSGAEIDLNRMSSRLGL